MSETAWRSALPTMMTITSKQAAFTLTAFLPVWLFNVHTCLMSSLTRNKTRFERLGFETPDRDRIRAESYSGCRVSVRGTDSRTSREAYAAACAPDGQRHNYELRKCISRSKNHLPESWTPIVRSTFFCCSSSSIPRNRSKPLKRLRRTTTSFMVSWDFTGWSSSRKGTLIMCATTNRHRATPDTLTRTAIGHNRAET